MFRKNYFSFLLTAVLFLAGSVAVWAQNQPVGGRILLKGADGKMTPVEGAVVEVFRTDVKAKFPSDKTDKKGQFNFAGLPLGGTFVLSISGPGIGPEIIPNIKAGMDNLTINVLPGDGKQWTEEEVRTAITTSTNTTQPTKESEDAKKQREEYEKKVAEINSKNEKIKNQTAAVQKALDEGNQAYKSNNLDVAIVKYEEGYQANPDFVGSAPVLLNNKGAALNARAVNVFNAKPADTAGKNAALAKVRQDLIDSADAYNKSWLVLKNAPATDINDPKTHELNKLNTLNGAKATFRLMAQTEQVDASKMEIAKSLTSEYLTIETDQAKKAEAQRILGDLFRVAGDSDNAIIEYRKALELSPDNPDALAGLGLSLFNAGVSTENKEQMQEGLNVLERFATVAPDTHKLKASVKDAVDYLKNEQKLTPQKVTKTTNPKKKN